MKQYFRAVKTWVLVPLLIGGFGGVSRAQVNSVYFFEVTHVAGGSPDINDNIRKDNPFNSIRGKFFLNSWLTDDIGVFTKFLYDDDTEYPYTGKIRLDGAYFLFDYLPALKVKTGKIPINIGSFPTRNYMEKNPLIGSPLMYQLKTAIPYNKVGNIADILEYRGRRQGVSLLYEACWDNGVEIFGSHLKFDYSFAVTKAAVVSPNAASNDGEQFIGRLGFRPTVGTRLGIGYARAPYLEGDAENLPEGNSVEDYIAEVLNVDYEYTAGFLELYGEWVKVWYDTGPAREKLWTTGYYLEAKYSLFPRLYAAGRYSQLFFEDVKTPSGTMEPWDYEISRLELGLGYSLTRKVVVKGVGQLNAYRDAPLDDVKFVSLQIKAEL